VNSYSLLYSQQTTDHGQLTARPLHLVSLFSFEKSTIRNLSSHLYSEVEIFLGAVLDLLSCTRKSK
jgi:hypothetical protein